jgi:hypothetical protein
MLSQESKILTVLIGVYSKDAGMTMFLYVYPLLPFPLYNLSRLMLMSVRKLRMNIGEFPSWKRGIFRRGKEVKGLRGGVHRYAVQASPRIDAATAEKNRFQTETML